MATKDRTTLKDEFKNGNLATGERFADLIDSMKVVQEPVTDPAASGTTLSFIASIEQDADGKIIPTKKTLDLANAHELNPFKGWWKTGDTLPTTGFDGAYLYFKDTSELTGQTTIYRWNGTAYADTGTVVDTSNVQTFESGQAVNAVKIKDASGQEVTGPAGVLSAEAVMPLAVKLEGMTATEYKVSLGTKENGAINGSTGVVLSSGQRYEITLPDGVKKVRFLGAEASSSSYPYGFAFYDDAETPNVLKCELYRINGNSSTRKNYEIISDVPNGAKTFKFSLSSLNTDIAYCYLQSGESVKDNFDKLYSSIDESVISETDYASVVSQGNTVLDIYKSESDSYIKRGSSETTAMSGYINLTQDAVKNYKKLKIIGYTNRNSYLIFFKKNIIGDDGLPEGEYGFDELNNLGYLCEGATVNNYITKIVSRNTNPNGIVVDIPKDAISVWIRIKLEGNYPCEPDSIIPFGVKTKGDIEKIVDEKLEDFTPINVIDNLESDSETDALSAKQGKILSQGTLYEEKTFDPRLYPFYNKVITQQGAISSANSAYSVNIPLQDVKYIKVTTTDNGVARLNFLKESLETGSITPATGYTSNYFTQAAGTTEKYNVPADAKYLYVHIGSAISKVMDGQGTLCPKSITFYVKKNNQYAKTTGFVNGYVGIDGNIHESDKYAVSGYIDMSKGFYMKFNDEYMLDSAHLYDMKGNLISYNYLPTTGEYMAYPYWIQDYSFYSVAFCIPYQIRVIIRRRDGGGITNTDNIVKSFVYLNDRRLHIEQPSFGIQYYNNFRARLRQLAACMFIPTAYMPTTTSQSQNDMNRQFFRKGQYRAGVAYSLNAQCSKAVGMEVSLKTYLSAIADKYSLAYTESLSGTVLSAYGLSYVSQVNTAAKDYYGCVCSSFVGYGLNMKNLFRSGMFENANVPGTELVNNVDSSNIQVGDLLWNDGHISVISEIYNDELGNRKFIVWAEQTKPAPYMCAMTTEEFDFRLSYTTYKVLRYTNWSNIDTPCNFEVDININNFFETNPILAPIKNIQTFAGDYATFTKGDIIYFTVNLKNGYTKLEIYDESDVKVDEVSIENLSYNDFYSGFDDYGSLEYTNNDLTGGVYTAKLTDGNGNYSEETHFEIVEINFQITKNNSEYVCAFSCSSNAQPYLLRKEDGKGYEDQVASGRDDYAFLAADDISKSVSWNISSSYKYIKLFCKGRYGVAVKKINAYEIE